MTDWKQEAVLPKPVAADGYCPQNGKEVTFLLGTDVHIGDPDTREQRVAITPTQAGDLKRWLETLGLKAHIFVVKDAGARAGFPDDEYVAQGARIIEEGDLATMSPVPDVVHALKESTHYEATIPGPFLRIGALHSGDFKPSCGLAQVLTEGAFCGVFDGSAVGGFAFDSEFEVRPKFRIPLRSSMSVYAGKLAGEDVGKQLGAGGERVVVSGGGVVGTSAIDVLLEDHEHQLSEVLIIEKFASRCKELRDLYQNHPVVRVKQGFEVTEEDIRDAAGLILTIFVQGSAITPKVVDLDRLRLMKSGGYVVDVAIDEGGGVAISKDGQVDPHTGRPVMVTIEDIRGEVETLPNRLTYHADNHMPRRRPREASIEHGNTCLMYLATLLYLCAEQGGPKNVIKAIMDQDNLFKPKTIRDALVLDLKNGMAFTKLNEIVVLYRHVLKKSDDIQTFLNDAGVLNTFA